MCIRGFTPLSCNLSAPRCNEMVAYQPLSVSGKEIHSTARFIELPIRFTSSFRENRFDLHVDLQFCMKNVIFSLKNSFED